MSLLSYLPQHEGLLPRWLFFVSIVSALNSSQAYLSSNYTAQLYNNAPANAVQSRTFGTWTFLSSIIRLYAAYYISESHVYDLAMWTYGIAFAHFVSEWLIFGSAKAKGRFISPLFVASGSLLWMATQRKWYSA
ncbi:ergosterol biosynthesis protein [Paracoccidioides lutzii Pb01]|uniref:Ergosterol biosynthesis protein n=1 Tax=Paracoccidioides lutzii (strain ATCC MYA-826 / Pb01) TaxID=502779 RepID=C1GYV2_PARBA|nr:ergosterol biosynthesis protein [Paracoccidioides lutzii Pb01]EEH41775.1 ergosterol biosynthesis protein [Paracoccidioides lutzii Pb01]